MGLKSIENNVMRISLFLFSLLCSIYTIGQVNGEWKLLPKVEGTPAIIKKLPAKVVSSTKKNPPFYVKSIFENSAISFQYKIEKKKLGELEFTASELQLVEKKEIPFGLIFKDLATKNIKCLNQEHGLFFKGINSIVEDNNGVIFMGSGEGLLSYNGSEMYNYLGTNDFSFRGIINIFSDSLGRIWVSTDKGICYIFKNKVYTPKNNIIKSVTRFREERNTLLFCTRYDGVYLLKSDGLVHYKEGLHSLWVEDALIDDKERIWIGVRSRGLSFIKNDSLFFLKRVKTVEEVPLCFHEHNGALWIGSFDKKILKLKGDSLFSITIDTDEKNRVWSLKSTYKGLYGANYGKGVFLIKENNEVEWFSKENGGSNDPYNLFEDSFENIWVGSLFEGVFRIDENIFSQNENAITDGLTCKIIDADNATWYLKNGKSLLKETNQEYTEITNVFDSIYWPLVFNFDGFCKSDTVWMSTYDKGVARLVGDEFTFYRMDTVPLHNTLFQIEPDDNEGIWCLNYENNLMLLKDSKYYNYSDVFNLPKVIYTNLINTSTGLLFILTENNGIIVIKDNEYQIIKIDHLGHLFEDENKAIWVVLDNTIKIFDNDKLIIELKDSILNKNGISTMIQLDATKIMALSSKGVFIITIDNATYSIAFKGGDYGTYLLGNASLYKSKSNKVLISGNDKNIRYNSYFSKRKKHNPKLSLQYYTINDTIYSNGKFPEKIEQETKFNLIFNKINWGNKSILKYKLTFENKEAFWETKKTNTLSFNHLNYGSYALIVYAQNGVQKSEILRYEFKIIPYWYQTWWFKITVILFVLFLLFIYINNKARRAKKIEFELKKLVEQKTIQIQAEKDAVSNQLSKNKLLLKEVNHRVKNNMQMVSSLLELQTSHVNDDNSKKALKSSISRIRALGYAHQELYKNDDYSFVFIHDYLKLIVDQLCHNLDCSVTLDIDTSFQMQIEKAQSLGFIINELITNSVKHAWKEGGFKRIDIKLFNDKKNARLIYKDNGKGFPENFEYSKQKSLGSTLISSFVSRQLGGQIEMSKLQKAEVIIKFKIEDVL